MTHGKKARTIQKDGTLQRVLVGGLRVGPAQPCHRAWVDPRGASTRKAHAFGPEFRAKVRKPPSNPRQRRVSRIPGGSTPGVVAKYASYFPTLEYAVAFNKYQNLQNIPLIDKFVDAYSV